MSVEGIWTTEILGLFGWETTGIVILEKGRAVGGGIHHHSVGEYRTSDGQIELELAVEYHGTPRTIFGASDKNLTVKIEAEVKGDVAEGRAFRVDNPGQYVTCKLTRRAFIPANSD